MAGHSGWNWMLATGILSNNARLDCQAAGIGHDRPGLRAVGADPLCAAASPSLFAPTGKTGDAMPSRDGDGSGSAIIRGIVSRR